ncbi:MAG: endo-1,4-beta-xylanase [Granulosicoccus sp.]
MLQHLANSHRVLVGLPLILVLCLGSCSSSDNSDGGGTAPGNTAELPGVTPQPADAITDPPDQNDEPVREAPEFNNAAGFEVFREPHDRLPVLALPDDATDELEFSAGLPAPVLTIPPDLDTSENSAPFFSGLQNLDVVAGEMVAILFDPQDLNDNLPGMYPQNLPLGATFDDNRDGTKTFRWQPLQADAGIFRLTVVAVDAEEPDFLSSQSVLIRITLPEDPSSIPNVAPMLETPRVYSVRVNDPVVVELKGQDLNGTIPTLELPEPPDGASFLQHPRFDEVYVLKFTPQVTGEFVIDVLVRDSEDPNLTSVETVSISVLDAQSFEGNGLTLKDLGWNHELKVGFAAAQSFYHQPDGAVYADIAAREFNIVTPENSMKMDTINPLPGHYEFAATDNLIRFAKRHEMQVHGHPLVWHRQLPEWITKSEVADREQHMNDFIQRIMERYHADIPIWDVVNEPIGAEGSLRSDSVWFEAMGEFYIDKALQQARSISPSAALLINEFDIGMAGEKFSGLVQLIERLQARNVPLDGIGFQLHLFDNFSTFEQLRNNFTIIESLGLDIYITELDVSISAEGEPSSQQLIQQADVYREIAEICVQHSRCKALQMWGFTDQYSFRSNFNPLPYDRAYQQKPAYQALQQALSISPQ